MIASALLILFGVYLACGLAFAVPFALFGVGKIDTHAARGTWGFRLLIIPGTILLWPMLAQRWLKDVHEPPEERNAHRQNAKCKMQNAECVQTKNQGHSSGSILHSAFSTLHFL